MFFILSKLFGYIIKPFNIILILIGVSFFIKSIVWKRRLRVGALIIFLIFSNGIILNECLLRWEKPAVLIMDLADDYDLAVVLGGTTDVDREPHDRLYFHRGAERVTQAINLYHAGKVNKILFTGGNARLFEDANRDNSPIYNFYVMCGVAPEDILIENSSRNTHENAVYVKKLLEERGVPHGKVILVTSAFHMRRAEGCFQKIGINVTGFSSDFYAALPKDRFGIDGFIPSPTVLKNWDFLIKEWIGYIAYWFAGYL